MKEEISVQLHPILTTYDSTAPQVTANELRNLWLQFEPKRMDAIKAELREQQETVGIPVPVLKTIGKDIGKVARKRVADFIPLTKLLWDEYGREGRVVSLITLGAMELVEPEKIVPLLREMCPTCVTWEDADRLAMDALEPIVRKHPAQWLPVIESWLSDDNKWVRRSGVTVVGRLPMKHPDYTSHCVALIERLLLDEEVEVKKAVSFALRLCVRGEIEPVRTFLMQQVPPENPVATWVLCDVIRSMAKRFLPEFVSLLPLYETWANDPAISTRDRRSVESALKTLQKVQ